MMCPCVFPGPGAAAGVTVLMREVESGQKAKDKQTNRPKEVVFVLSLSLQLSWSLCLSWHL